MKILEAAAKKRLKKYGMTTEGKISDNEVDEDSINRIESLLHKATQQQSPLQEKEIVEAHQQLHRKATPPIVP